MIMKSKYWEGGFMRNRPVKLLSATAIGAFLALVAPVNATTIYSFVTLAVPGFPEGINVAGEIVGYYRDSSGPHGFLYNGGSSTPINVPGSTETYAYGINNPGQIVGYYFPSGPNTSGFLNTAGSYSSLNAPAASGGTYAYGINDAGQRRTVQWYKRSRCHTDTRLPL
jgi:hypothetical protein